MKLNVGAFEICGRIIDRAVPLRVAHEKIDGGTLIVDCGARAAGGLEAGRLLAECCMAGLGHVSLTSGNQKLWRGLSVEVHTDHPVAACMAAQYAGWEIKADDYFAMGSGPMRAAANKEELFETIGYAEQPEIAVGILESRDPPTRQVSELLAGQCGVSCANLVLLFAPTASQAGSVQIVARSIETALHKLYELGFDLDRVESGFGTAPLPPVAENDLAGIGRTNDAILYGAEVTLWLRGDDKSLATVGPQIPSNSSPDHGEPFANIFARHDHDFYKIDRQLFSPAVVTLVNLDTGQTQRFGETSAELIHQSFMS
ncbi:MAG: methenyltetrahydromethanopterin cyclohydrolase [Planctomycetota bacterium]|nr:methenyltetrahydromethanopterin cyclohydrolase [Planctomycetota bacterium]